jgi:hypothetical protein
LYYVYQYVREDGTPYYIGKGKGNRAWSASRTVHKPIDETRIIIVEDGLTEEESFRLEKTLIEQHGRKDQGTGILRNLTDGGEGNSGRIVTHETRNKISKANGGKVSRSGFTLTTEHKHKISEANKGHMRDTSHLHTKEVIEKRANSLRGYQASNETRSKMSAAHTGKTLSTEHKNKISKGNTGKVLSDHTKQQISASKLGDKNPMYGVPSPMRGKTYTEEQKRQIRKTKSQNAKQRKTNGT